MPKTKEYLDYCTDRELPLSLVWHPKLTLSTDATCQVTRCREIKMDRSLYCPNHTCRERDCEKSCFSKPYCDERRLFCDIHLLGVLTRNRCLCRTHMRVSQTKSREAKKQREILPYAYVYVFKE